MYGVIETIFQHHLVICLPTLGKKIEVSIDALEKTSDGLSLRSDTKVEHVFLIKKEPAKEMILVPQTVLAQLKP